MAPERLVVPANGLSHTVLLWHPPQPLETPAATRRLALLLHGFMDAAGTWEQVVPALTGAGFTVAAPHLRGFGDGPRVGLGGYYHFVDYIFDVADLVDALSGDAKVHVVGHSMGGTIASLYAGSFPERVAGLALLEGTGPLDSCFELAPVRMRRWIDDVREQRGKPGKALGSREDALRRLIQNHRGVDRAVLERMLEHLVTEDEAGALSWKADPLHRTLSPVPFYAGAYREFARLVTCPVLSVDGGPQGYQPPDEPERLAAFARLTKKSLPGAGHMMHWTQPEAVAKLLVDFFST